MSQTQLQLAVQFLNHRLTNDHTTFVGHTKEFNQIMDLISRTSEDGESNSALVIGPYGCGKTTMITSILSQALTNSEFRNNTVIVNLNGFVHTDDAAALKSITRQMRLEMAVDGKVFATFADNLAFLLDCLKTGNRSKSKSVIYILEEFDLFCSHANQTLIYNLFDVAQSAQAPICVIGLTGRYDVMELLEKRVKSRFSHRQVFLIDEMNELGMLSSVFVNLLKLPKLEEMTNADYVERQTHSKQSPLPLLQTDFDLTEYAFERNFINKWNKEVNGLSSNKTFKATIGALFELNVKLAKVKNIMFRVVANIDGLDADRSAISTAKLAALIQRIIEEIHNPCDSKLEIMCDLSILEFSLLIAMKHHSDIYDHEPFNFEIILTRLHKFQNAGDVSVINYKRDVVLKAFDVLKHCELIIPAGHSHKGLKEYQMFKLFVANEQIDRAVTLYKNLPTNIGQWAKSSQV